MPADLGSILMQGVKTINWFLGYLRNNIFLIVALVVAIYYVRMQLIEPFRRRMAQRAQNSSLASASSSATTVARADVRFKSDAEKQEDLRRIRFLQQEKSAILSAAAEKVRKEKEAQERMRKNLVAQKRDQDAADGDRLGGEKKKNTTTQATNKKSTSTTTTTSTTITTTSSSARGGGYNPLNPWSSGSGGGYKAQKRSARRG